MSRHPRPQLWVVAGPNGAGKTTLVMRRLQAASRWLRVVPLRIRHSRDVAQILSFATEEKVSGAKRDRPALARLIEQLCDEDIVVVESSRSAFGRGSAVS